MMNLNRNVLQTLMSQQGEWGVSIYLPTHRNSLEVRQDALRLKNLLREADTQLQSLGMPEDKVYKMLRPARELLEQNSFWQHQREGLALFLTEDIYQWFALPMHFPELCVVTERFHLKPLLRWLTSDGGFHLLTLSKKQVRLFEGTRYKLDRYNAGGHAARDDGSGRQRRRAGTSPNAHQRPCGQRAEGCDHPWRQRN